MSGRLNPPDVIAAGGPAHVELYEACIDAYPQRDRARLAPLARRRARGELDPPDGYMAEQISAALNNKGRTGRISLGDIYALARAPGPGVAEARSCWPAKPTCCARCGSAPTRSSSSTQLCEQRAPVARDGGHDPVPGHAGDTRWKRRVRGALQGLRRAGAPTRIGRSSWAIQGTAECPTRLLLIVAGASRASSSCAYSPPSSCWPSSTNPPTSCSATRRGRSAAAAGTSPTGTATGATTPGWCRLRGYRRRPVPGVHPRLGAQAAAALRPGGQLAVITGPQRAAIVQCAAEDAGLTWVSSIAARREFPLATLRRRPAPTGRSPSCAAARSATPAACSTRRGTCRPRAAAIRTRSTGGRRQRPG